MNRKTPFDKFFKFLPVVFCITFALGIVFRFWRITHNEFLFYDEGMYLTYNRELLEKIHQFPARSWSDICAIFKILFYTSLTTAKWLWFFISNLRVFAGGPEMFYFTRIISAFCGVMTVVLTYFFAKRYFQSTVVALISAAILAVLPSHVFYSRLAMQESLSTLCFLLGMYLYIYKDDFGWRTIAASLFFSAVFFTNYRMIVLPVLLLVAQTVLSLGQKKPFHLVKFAAATLMFLGFVFWIGSLNHGSNRTITLAWMTHQAQDAPHQWQLLNILSYPYAIFSLEGFLFGVLLFANIYWLIRRDWSRLFPFALIAVQMIMFTAASEKGIRYLCVVLPFAAMAAAQSLQYFILKATPARHRYWGILAVVLFFCGLTLKSWAIATSGSGYQEAVEFIQTRDKQAKVLTTQPLLAQLYMPPENITPAPKTFRDMIILYARGYRYLLIDPQAYVSWTADRQRFTPELADYLGFVRDRMPPLYVADHLNNVTLQRFVLDHNENLPNSIRFLHAKDRHFGAIYVYDINDCLQAMQKIAQSQGK